MVSQSKFVVLYIISGNIGVIFHTSNIRGEVIMFEKRPNEHLIGEITSPFISSVFSIVLVFNRFLSSITCLLYLTVAYELSLLIELNI